MSTPLTLPGPGIVAVGGLRQARKHKREYDAVITLEDPGCRKPLQLRFTHRPHPAHLVLPFEDVDHDDGRIRVASLEQVEKALAFGRDHASGSLLVHCYHGVGRSAATALAIIADRLGAGHEEEAVDYLLTIRPEATPNLIVTAHGDELLRRGGALLGALARREYVSAGTEQLRAARKAFVLAHPELYAVRAEMV